MKVSVVTTESGDILAVGPPPGTAPDAGADGPSGHAFVPLAGQQVHTADLPDHLATEEGLARLHRTHRISTDGDLAAFVDY